MTLREKRDALNMAIALLIALAAGEGPEIQDRVEATLQDLQAMEKELYPPEGRESPKEPGEDLTPTTEAEGGPERP